MLLVFGGDEGDSFRNLDRCEVAFTKATFTHTYSTQHHERFIEISFQNHQDGLHTTHTTTQALSAGCGRKMSSRNTMLLVFSRGGPGSYRSREQRVVISQKAQQILMSLNIHFQNS